MGREAPGLVAVLCVVSSGGLMLRIGITSCTFPPSAEMSKKNDYENMKITVRGKMQWDVVYKVQNYTLPIIVAMIVRVNLIRWVKIDFNV